MCFHTKQGKTARQLEHRFKAKIDATTTLSSQVYNGFEHPFTPVITHTQPAAIQLFQWGLIPTWSYDNSIQKITLNARIETIAEKKSFKDSIHHRCLILVDGFYEWKWLDRKAKQKEKYLLSIPNDSPFALAGIWSKSKNNIHTYSILTTEANELMSTIHNSKKRMPVMVSNEKEWLAGGKVELANGILIATLQTESIHGKQISLFD